MNTVGMIEVTGVPLESLVQAAYNPSRHQGLGFIHFKDGDLTAEEIAQIVDRSKNDKMMAISMDYVKGRSCKFHVLRSGERLFIRNNWYDHSTSQIETLLTSVGLPASLVDQARKEQKEREQTCMEKALSLLDSKGGSFTSAYDEEKDEDIQLGLYIAQDRKIVKEEYKDGKSTWSRLDKAA